MTSASGRAQRVPAAVLAAAFLFNLGQGVLRPAMPLYLQRTFSANYRMVTLIPVVFGAGKWIANLPSGYLLERLGRLLMVAGLGLIALLDVLSVLASRFDVFLGLRALGGVGWAMFATVATTTMVNLPGAERRGRTVSLLLMSETSGLLVGSAAGGWLYQRISAASPFVFEAACMLVAALVVARWASRSAPRQSESRNGGDRRLLHAVLRTPGVLLMGMINAALIAIQTGILVFLFPLYLVDRGNVGPQTMGVLVSLSVLGRLPALWVGGSVADRSGRVRVLMPGLAIYAALLASVVFLTRPVALGVLSVGIGAAAGFVAALPTAIIGDRVPPASRGVAIGWLRTMTDGGQILGPLVMGTIADAIDLSAPFLFGALLLIATAGSCRFRAHAMSPAHAPAGETQ
jgi:MFS family permease